jgi:hypothetical protein
MNAMISSSPCLVSPSNRRRCPCHALNGCLCFGAAASCPGDYCFYNPQTLEQECTHCCQASYVHKDGDLYVPNERKVACDANHPGTSHGICDGFGLCQCTPPFVGEDCAIRECANTHARTRTHTHTHNTYTHAHTATQLLCCTAVPTHTHTHENSCRLVVNVSPTEVYLVVHCTHRNQATVRTTAPTLACAHWSTPSVAAFVTALEAARTAPSVRRSHAHMHTLTHTRAHAHAHTHTDSHTCNIYTFSTCWLEY